MSRFGLASLVLLAWLAACMSVTDRVTEPQKASRWKSAPEEKWRI